MDFFFFVKSFHLVFQFTQIVVNQIHNLRHHDGPQRQSWSERRRVTPLSLTSDHF